MYRFYYLLLMCFVFVLSHAQEAHSPRFYGIESGMQFYDIRFNNLDFVREERNVYRYGESSTSNPAGYFQKATAGAKAEFRLWNYRIGVLGGVRYTQMSASLGRSGPDSKLGNGFLVLDEETDTEVRFLHLRSIDQRMSYVGIPVEGRFFCWTPKLFRLYVRTSFEIAYLVNSTTDIRFFDKTMELHSDVVQQKFEKPDKLFAEITLSPGMKIGRPNTLNFNIELCLPAIPIDEFSTGIVMPQMGYGFNVHIQYPF